MTQNEFLAVCGEVLIPPELALEDEEVKEAVKAGDMAALYAALVDNF